jgi:hypothetical protein
MPRQSVDSRLSAAPTFQRRQNVVYDGTCQAASDSSGRTCSYRVFPIRSPVTEPLEALVGLGSLPDSVMFLYCAFDSGSPQSHLRAWNDDYSLTDLASVFWAGDGFVVEAGTVYYLVVTGFAAGQTGDFDLRLSGNARFASGFQPALPGLLLND